MQKEAIYISNGQMAMRILFVWVNRFQIAKLNLSFLYTEREWARKSVRVSEVIKCLQKLRMILHLSHKNRFMYISMNGSLELVSA